MYRIGILLAIILLVAGSSTSLAQIGSRIEPTFPDVPYVEDGDYKQKLDIYLPESDDEAAADEDAYPVIFLLHGNGYTKWDMKPLAAYFIERGYAAVAIEYRDDFPELGEDVFCAVAWSFANSDIYMFDAARFFVLGHSQGGFAAALVGVTNEPSDYLENCPDMWPEDHELAGIILYAAGGLDRDVIAEAVDGTEPPFLLIHGEIDRLVTPDQSEAFAATLEDTEVDVTFVLLDEVNHFFTNPLSEAGSMAIEYVDSFLSDILIRLDESDEVVLDEVEMTPTPSFVD